MASEMLLLHQHYLGAGIASLHPWCLAHRNSTNFTRLSIQKNKAKVNNLWLRHFGGIHDILEIITPINCWLINSRDLNKKNEICTYKKINNHHKGKLFIKWLHCLKIKPQWLRIFFQKKKKSSKLGEKRNLNSAQFTFPSLHLVAKEQWKQK